MGRTVVVTGGNRGIGRAIAEAFIANGDRVAVTVRDGQGPDGALAVKCDVAQSEEVDRAFDEIEKELGPVEIVVSNAGTTRDGLILRMSDDDFEAVMETNLAGAFRVARRASKSMLRQRKGRLIFIGSVVGMVGSAGQTNYSASKAGLIGLARSLSRELGSRSITANVIAPGFVSTDMTAALGDKRKEEIANAIPLGRYGTVQEIAACALFLASDDAGYITGAVIPVDGGLGMGS